MKKIPQDIIGNIAFLKFPKWAFGPLKWWLARRFLKQTPSVRTVLDKKGGFSGELRIPKLVHVAGEKNFIALYKENDCVFRFDVRETYFSGRLSQDRKIIAEEVMATKKKNLKILVLFSGVGPYPIVLGRMLKKAGVKAEITAIELNEKACEYAVRNVRENKLEGVVSIVNEDVRELSGKVKGSYDVILMMRPNLSETFLSYALTYAKKGTIVFYHGFGTEESVKEEILRDAGKRVKGLILRKCGDIGAYKFRYTAKFTVR